MKNDIANLIVFVIFKLAQYGLFIAAIGVFIYGLFTL